MPTLKNRHIAIVFTAAIVGGHELMAVEHIKKLRQKGLKLVCFVPDDNQKLMAILDQAQIPYQQHDVRHQKLEILHAFFNLSLRARAARFLKKLAPQVDDIVLIQGDIELGSVFVNMAARQKLPVISYIPYAHSFSKMGAKLAGVKDALGAVAYKRCQRYITISACFADDLRRWNPQAQVRVLPNFVPAPPAAEIRGTGYTFTPQPGTVRILMPGRVSFRQKGQDVLADALARLGSLPVTFEVVVAGDGPDLEALKARAATLPGNVRFRFLGWVSPVWPYATEADFIVIPSQFEGVPLVMLEAQKRNIPIIASRRDGMKDYLPASAVYGPEDAADEPAALAVKISDYVSTQLGITARQPEATRRTGKGQASRQTLNAGHSVNSTIKEERL